jgi:hypothetical protein
MVTFTPKIGLTLKSTANQFPLSLSPYQGERMIVQGNGGFPIRSGMTPGLRILRYTQKDKAVFIFEMWFCAALTPPASRMSGANREDLIFDI